MASLRSLRKSMIFLVLVGAVVYRRQTGPPGTLMQLRSETADDSELAAEGWMADSHTGEDELPLVALASPPARACLRLGASSRVLPVSSSPSSSSSSSLPPWTGDSIPLATANGAFSGLDVFGAAASASWWANNPQAPRRQALGAFGDGGRRPVGADLLALVPFNETAQSRTHMVSPEVKEEGGWRCSSPRGGSA